MPKTKQSAADRRKHVVFPSLKKTYPKSNAVAGNALRVSGNKTKSRAALGDYGAGKPGLILTMERAFDPEGKDRDKWQAKRMAPYSYPSKAAPSVAVKGRGIKKYK